MTAAVLLLHGVGTPGHSGSLLLSFSPFASLGLSVDIPGFRFLLFRFLLSQHCWFPSLGFPPRFLPFPPLLLLPFRSLFIGAGGAGSTLPRPIAAHAWGARLLHCYGAGRGGQWRRRLRGTASLSAHHEEVRVASGFGFNRARGERERGRNKRKRTKTSLPLLRVQGKKKEEQCRLKRHCFVFPLCVFF